VEQPYDQGRVRYLRDSERAVSATARHMPLVLEPRADRSMGALQELLRANVDRLQRDAAEHGAVLLRGWDVADIRDFERTILAVPGMRGMNRVLNSEPGRVVVEGADYVLHPNTLSKTGGTMVIQTIHTENFYVPDVPRYISFYCIQPSWLGGETGLVDMAGLYADLPPELQAELERAPLVTGIMSIDQLAQRYDLTAEEVEAFARAEGLAVTTLGDGWFAIVYKPCVVQHPLTEMKALLINLSGELGGEGLTRDLHQMFLRDYRGLKWTIHRMAWRALLGIDTLLHPRLASVRLDELLLRFGVERKRNRGPLDQLDRRLARRVTRRHVRAIARSTTTRRSCGARETC
jgi:alpha-ketoglutarate-dependent taurine dioxygenase